MCPRCLRTTQPVWSWRSSEWSSVCGTPQVPDHLTPVWSVKAHQSACGTRGDWNIKQCNHSLAQLKGKMHGDLLPDVCVWGKLFYSHDLVHQGGKHTHNYNNIPDFRRTKVHLVIAVLVYHSRSSFRSQHCSWCPTHCIQNCTCSK